MRQEWTVEGMTCGHCERAVEAALGAVPGVVSAKADRATKRVDIAWQEGATPNDEAVLAALDDEGYTGRPRAEGAGS